jgi:hypothetical protein
MQAIACPTFYCPSRGNPHIFFAAFFSPCGASAKVALNSIDSLTARRRQKLEAAGIRDLVDLAKADLAQVSRATGIPMAPLQDYQRKAAASVILDILRSNGVGVLPFLADAALANIRQQIQALRPQRATSIPAIDLIELPASNWLQAR